MLPEPRNLRPFLFLFAGMIAWWLAPAVFRRAAYTFFYEFEAPALTLSSQMSDLARYWEMRSRDKDELIRAGRDTARFASGLQYEIAQLAELREENARLREMLGLETRPDFRIVAARVAQRRLSMWWQQIVLRRGKDAGIRPGCPVVNAYGVVGRVRDVFSDTCVVELISSPSFRVSAKIDGGENRVVTYEGAGASPLRSASGKIRDIPAGTEISAIAARSVVTSGLGGIFPAGLKIGTLDGVPAASDDGIFLEVPVKISPELASIDEVAVLVPVKTGISENPVPAP